MASSSVNEAFYTELNSIVSEKMSYLQYAGIKEFGYRVFSNNQTIGFCTHKEWTQFSFEQSYAKDMSNHYSSELNNLITQQSLYCIRSGHRDPNSKFLEGLYHHGLWNTLIVYRRSHDKVEGFYFVASIENNRAMDVFIRERALFDSFVTMVQKPINNLASEKRWKELAIEFRGLNLPIFGSNIESKTSEFELAEFQHNNSSDNFKLRNIANIIGLNIPEIHYLALAIEGYSHKQIGIKLNISQSTAERRFASLKNKLGIRGKKQLKATASNCNLTQLINNYVQH